MAADKWVFWMVSHEAQRRRRIWVEEKIWEMVHTNENKITFHLSPDNLQ